MGRFWTSRYLPHPAIVGCMVAGSACGRIRFDSVPVDLANDCVLWLKMDEPSWSGVTADVLDSCGQHAGLALGSAARVDDSVRARVGSFPATSGVLIAEASDLDAVDGVTMSAWFLASAFDGQSHGLVSKRTNNGIDPAYSMFHVDGHVVIDIASDGMRVSSTPAFSVERWVQVTATFDGHASPEARTRLYFDGALAEVLPEIDATIAPSIQPPLTIGTLGEGGEVTCPQPECLSAESAVGLLDDVAVWTRPLDADEVAAWYEQTAR